MKGYSLHLIVGLFAVLAGIGTARAWLVYRSFDMPAFSRSAEEDNLSEAVFRNYIEESQKDGSHRLYFLSRGENMDPSDEFMLRFKSDALLVKKVSQSVKGAEGVEDQRTKEPGWILSINRIKWLNGGEAQVSLSRYAWSWGQAGYSYRVIKDKGRWIVKLSQQTSVT